MKKANGITIARWINREDEIVIPEWVNKSTKKSRLPAQTEDGELGEAVLLVLIIALLFVIGGLL